MWNNPNNSMTLRLHRCQHEVILTLGKQIQAMLPMLEVIASERFKIAG